MVVAAPPATSVARVASCALWGLEAALVTVEVDVANGLPAFNVVGLPDAAVSDLLREDQRLLFGAGRAVGRLSQPKLMQKLLKTLAIFGDVDAVG